VLIFFIAGLLYLLCFEHVDNLGAYSIPPETGLLIPSVIDSYRAPSFRVMQKKSRPRPSGLLFSVTAFGMTSFNDTSAVIS
jgi:hypothetical protein